MYYATVGLIALLVLVIENYDILFKKLKNIDKVKEWKSYKLFLIAVIVYYITDVLWGILESQKLFVALYIDTVLYFIAMGSGLLFWSRFTVKYLGENKRSKILNIFSYIFFAFVLVISIINLFTPILFSLTQECEYKALWGRFVILLAQILLLSSISIYTFVSIINSYGQIRKRYRTIGLFGIIMSIFLIVQIFYPLLPIFSMAYMMGTCLLHTFVINDEKEEYKQELEEAFLRETKHYDDLKRAKDLAYTDALTGAKSKVAYNELEDIIDIQIRQKTVKDFKIAIFDVNNLKVINDLYGHKFGDKYIIDSCNIIKNYFSNSKIYRIGGDEFMAFLIDDDYNKSEDLERGFIDEMKKPKSKFDPVIALGIAKFELTDNSFNDVFRRADKLMYDNKTELKRL